jgi:putative ABC transport system substrate-binding protein
MGTWGSPVRRAARALACLLIAGLVGSAAPVHAQSSTPRPLRIGVLFPDSPAARASMLDALRQSLRELGYVEGRHLTLDIRYAEDREDKLAASALELSREPVDILVTAGTGPTAAAQRATATIPIVMVGVGDPVARGFVASMSRPGGNITGSSDTLPNAAALRFELLKEAIPSLSRVAFIHNSAVTPTAAVEEAAHHLGLTLLPLEARGPVDIDLALRSVRRHRPDAVVVVPNPLTFAARHRIARLGLLDQVPVVFGWREFMDADGFMAYGASMATLYRRAAGQVDKIIKGARPGELPVEVPRFELVINLRTAKSLGITVPPSLLSVADHVIQ